MPSPIAIHSRWTSIAGALALLSLGCVSGETAHNPSDGGAGASGGGGGRGGSGAAAGQTGTGGGQGGATATGGTGGTIVGTGGSGGTPQPALPLPLVVTDVYNNQGWFGDGAVSAFFASGSMVIRQASSTSGPCAARAAGARGACLQVTYTPPAGLVQPDGGAGGTFVGVFFLTTLMMAHPELTPPALIGDANWGAEPGKLIASGATKISFMAASAADGQSVAFKAGVATDPFSLPEQIEVLTTTWQPYQMSLAGIFYTTPILGAFAWVLHDTSRPVTFYLDGIVWE